MNNSESQLYFWRTDHERGSYTLVNIVSRTCDLRSPNKKMFRYEARLHESIRLNDKRESARLISIGKSLNALTTEGRNELFKRDVRARGT